MEIAHGHGVTEIAVVICSKPLLLRKATAYEKFMYWFKVRRSKAGEIVAAVEAVEAIERARVHTR